VKDQREAILVVVKYRNIPALLAVVALFALELDAEPAPPALFGHHPRTLLPGRMMAHVLRVSALKIGHPIGMLVLMETDDFLFHRKHALAADYFPGLSAEA